MEVSGKIHALDALPYGKNPQYPLSKRLGLPHSPSGHFAEQLMPLHGIERCIAQLIS
jgi:hypothetical protein